MKINVLLELNEKMHLIKAFCFLKFALQML